MSYYDPATSFSVELYKGSWIQVCRGPEDRPASEYPEAQQAVAMWLGITRQKLDALR